MLGLSDTGENVLGLPQITQIQLSAFLKDKNWNISVLLFEEVLPLNKSEIFFAFSKKFLREFHCMSVSAVETCNL
jgi:hypothetical protein